MCGADHSTGNLVGKTDEVISFNVSQLLVVTVILHFKFLFGLKVRVGIAWFLRGGEEGGRRGKRSRRRERDKEEEEGGGGEGEGGGGGGEEREG